MGLAHPGICPYGVFTAQCGQDFVLSVQHEREWGRLCEIGIARADLLDDERCADNQTRVANRDFVDDAVRDAVAGLAYTELQERFEQADVNSDGGLSIREMHQLQQMQRSQGSNAGAR